MIFTPRRALIVAGLTAVLATSACKRAPGVEDQSDNVMADNAIEMPLDNGVLPPPVANIAAAENATAPAPDPQADEAQMRDDADATGLTARLPSSEDTAPAAGEAAGNAQ